MAANLDKDADGNLIRKARSHGGSCLARRRGTPGRCYRVVELTAGSRTAPLKPV